MSDKLEELNKLNETFYELFGRLYQNKMLLNNAKTYEYLGSKLFEQYKFEYELLRIKFEEIEEPDLYRENVRHGLLVPRRRFIFFRNRAQKIIDNEVIYELEKYFKQREDELKMNIEALERLNSALENCDAVNQGEISEPEEAIENQEQQKPKRKRRTRQIVSLSEDEQLDGQLQISSISSS